MFITTQTLVAARASIQVMRFIHHFLAGYFVVILSSGLGLWWMGMFSRVAPIWGGIGALVTIGVGIMLAVASGKPTLQSPRNRTGEMTRRTRLAAAGGIAPRPAAARSRVRF